MALTVKKMFIKTRLNNNSFSFYKKNIRIVKTGINSVKIHNLFDNSKEVFICPVCGQKVMFSQMQLDHITAKYKGGIIGNMNECFICANCHAEKTRLEKKGRNASKRYLEIQNKEKLAKKQYQAFYKFCEYVSHASKEWLEMHPRNSMKIILARVNRDFRLSKKDLKNIINNFGGKHKLNRIEVYNIEKTIKLINKNCLVA